MLDVLEAGGVTESNVRSLDVAEASIANEYGADLKTISAGKSSVSFGLQLSTCVLRRSPRPM